MNDEPHTHTLSIRRQYESINSGCYVLEYGDSRILIWRGPFLSLRIKMGAKRVIRKHDRGSIKAGQKQDLIDKFNNDIQQVHSKWASESDDSIGQFDLHNGYAPDVTWDSVGSGDYDHRPRNPSVKEP